MIKCPLTSLAAECSTERIFVSLIYNVCCPIFHKLLQSARIFDEKVVAECDLTHQIKFKIKGLKPLNAHSYSLPGPHEGPVHDPKAVGFRAEAREESNQEC